jgi:hypothetical protein
MLKIEEDLALLRREDITDEELSRLEEMVKREEEEEMERQVAKEKWLREREEKKRTLQVRK